MRDVTIVVPTRKRPDYLRTTLYSILASATEASRNGTSVEVLVVDDASPTESTRRLASELGVRYHRIATHDGRNNPATAIATGVGLVESEFYSVFGDDDIMTARFIPAHVEALTTGFDICSSAYLRTDADLRTTREVVLPMPAIGDLLAGRMTINDGAMTRTALAQDLPWDSTLDQVIFYPIWLELLDRGARVTRLTEPTFLYRRHSGNVSDHLDERDADLRNRIREEYRARILARDGVIPGPTIAVPKPVRAAKPPAPGWKQAARNVRRRLAGG